VKVRHRLFNDHAKLWIEGVDRTTSRDSQSPATASLFRRLVVIVIIWNDVYIVIRIVRVDSWIDNIFRRIILTTRAQETQH
jgi:hypothetical protein